MVNSNRFRTLAAAMTCGAAIMLVGAGVGSAASTPAVTGNAGSVTSTSAQLNGTIAPNGLDTFWAFQYGDSATYGQATPPVGPLTGTNVTSVMTLVTGLHPGTTYHFRLLAMRGAAGTSGEATGFTGSDVTFTTLSSGSSTTGKHTSKHANASLRSRTLHVRHGATFIPWACSGSAGATCKVHMSLTVHAKSGTVRCGSATFSAPTGNRRSVRVALGTSCVALVKAASHHRLTARLKATSTAGTGSLSANVTLAG